MTDVVKEPLNVAGLLTNIYSRSDLRDKATSEPVVVLFFLHGRGESTDTVDTVARAAFAWATERQASSKQKPRDFLVVTFVRGLFTPSLSDLTRADPCQRRARADHLGGMNRTSGTTARERWINVATWDGVGRRSITTTATRE